MEEKKFTPPSVKPLSPIGAPKQSRAERGAPTGAPTGKSTRENQKQVNRRMDTRGNQLPGPRLAQDRRPQAPGIAGTVGKAAKSKAMKWAMGAAFGGSLGAGGIIGYFIS